MPQTLRFINHFLFIEEKGGRPNRLAGQWMTVAEALIDGVSRSAKEAVNIIHQISGHEFSLIWARVLMKDAGMTFKKLQPVPGKADPEGRNSGLQIFSQLSRQPEKENSDFFLY